MASRGKTSTLSIVIAGDAKGAKKALSDTETQTKGLGKTAAGVGVAMGAALAGGAVIRGAKVAIDAYRSVGAEMMTLKRLTGGTEESVSGLWVAAQQSGVGIDKMTTALGAFQSKVANGTVEKMGIDVKNAAGETRSFDEILGDLQDTYADLADEDKAAFSRGLFGRGGTDMMKILSKSREEMAGFVEEAKELGITLNSDDIAEATKNQRDFELAMTASKVVIGKELLPAVTEMTGHLADNMPAIATAVGSVAGAFNALPKPIQGALAVTLAFGPAIRLATVAFGPLASIAGKVVGPLRDVSAGLTGMGQAGAGAGSSMGGFVGQVARSPLALAGAATALGLVTLAFVSMQQESAAAKRNVDDLVAATESGMSIEEAFRDRLASTLAGAEGGFQRSFGEDIQKGLDEMGISVEEFFQIVQAGGPQLDRLKGQFEDLAAENISDPGLSGSYLDAVTGIDNLRDAWEDSSQQERDLRETREALNVETGDTADTTDEAAGAEDEYAAAAGRASTATKDATSAVERRAQAMERQIAAARSVDSAETNLTDAQEELADAQRAAAAGSEELTAAHDAEIAAADAVADAVEAAAEAVDGIAEAEGGVVDALQAEQDALAKVNPARAEAAERIREMAEEARNLALDAEGADLKVRAAMENLDAILHGSGSQLEKDQAAHDLEVAKNEAANAHDAATDAAREAAEAERQGVDNAPEVIAAEQAVAEAHDGVTEAQDRVTEAKRRARDAADEVKAAEKRQAAAARDTAKVQEDAAARVVSASEDVYQAKLDLITAEGNLATAAYGVEAGLRAQIASLRDFAALLAPGSPERENLEWLITNLNATLIGGVRDPAYLADIGNGATVPGSPANPHGPSVPGGGAGRGGFKGQYVYAPNIYGSANEERRRARQEGEDWLNKAAGLIG